MGGASAAACVAAGLEGVGDEDPTKGSAEQKVARLAKLVKAERTLLVLDGMEPLQYPPGVDEGRLKDRAMGVFLRELAAAGEGLCVVTTREWVRDRADYEGSSGPRMVLDNLSVPAGRAVLRSFEVQGADGELDEAVKEYEGHALALTLLGSYLKEVYRGDIRRWKEIPPAPKHDRFGKHVHTVMRAYEKWLGDGAEVAILRMMGLFDRPADGGCVKALREGEGIEGLTDKVVSLSEEEWRRSVSRLRGLGLLGAEDAGDPEGLDAHPLVREYFGERLRAEREKAWRAGHRRLFDYLRGEGVAPYRPDTLKEMAPLYQAVGHGCRAGQYQNALGEVFIDRIRRGDEHFSRRKLGAFGADLGAIAGFFDPPWRRAVAELTEDARGWVLGTAGFALRGVGRLREAAGPIRAALKARIDLELWKNAAVNAVNLSELLVTLGEIGKGIEAAERSVELGDKSGYAFEQMTVRTTLADALHQAGRAGEAEAKFEEAEGMQKERQSQYPLLYSLRGYQYCDLLLGRGKVEEVLRRAGQTLEWATRAGMDLMSAALDHLSLGRALLLGALREGSKDFGEVEWELDRAVEGLREAGQQDDLPRGLLARAGLYRVKGAYNDAKRDLEEAMGIARRGSMRLHEADGWLEYARLHLAMGDKQAGRESLKKAKGIIEETGYHRRDSDVEEVEQKLQE